VSLECDARGDPEPVITWLKDGEVMDKNSLRHIRFLSGGRVLQIIAAKVDDTATYSCLAENVAGQEQRRFQLNVHGKDLVHHTCIHTHMHTHICTHTQTYGDFFSKI